MVTPEYLARTGTEDGEQAALFCFALDPRYKLERESLGGDTKWKLLYAVPNGGLREAPTAARMKSTGVRKGFPDIGLPVAVNPYHGLFVELKRKNGIRSDTKSLQALWHQALMLQCYHVDVAYGWLHAREIIAKYLLGCKK